MVLGSDQILVTEKTRQIFLRFEPRKVMGFLVQAVGKSLGLASWPIRRPILPLPGFFLNRTPLARG